MDPIKLTRTSGIYKGRNDETPGYIFSALGINNNEYIFFIPEDLQKIECACRSTSKVYITNHFKYNMYSTKGIPIPVISKERIKVLSALKSTLRYDGNYVYTI